jgi:hypothetical protein
MGKIMAKSFPWFRHYRQALNDPKIIRLSDALFRTWVNCLEATDEDGFLPPIEDLSVMFRLEEGDLRNRIEDLKGRRLIDEDSDRKLRMHAWENWQYKSDNSKKRVQKHRAEQRGNVTTLRPKQ